MDNDIIYHDAVFFFIIIIIIEYLLVVEHYKYITVNLAVFEIYIKM